MRQTTQKLVGLMLWAVFPTLASGFSVSSQTAQTINQLESIRDSGGDSRTQMNRLFDGNHSRSGVYPDTPLVFSVPMAHSGRSLSAISAEKKIRDAHRVSQILTEKAWRNHGLAAGHPLPGAYHDRRYPGYPGYGYPGYPGYGQHHYRPTLGDRVVDGVRSFFNHIEAGVNNIRHNLAGAIEPRYPYVTRYQKIPSYYGNMEIPVYRYRHGTYDIPGYGHIPGYRPGYGYPGFGGHYPPRMDYGGFYGHFPGYEWRQGYGYISDNVFTSAFSGQYQFVPQTRGGGTIQRIPGR